MFDLLEFKKKILLDKAFDFIIQNCNCFEIRAITTLYHSVYNSIHFKINRFSSICLFIYVTALILKIIYFMGIMNNHSNEYNSNWRNNMN